MAPRRKVKRIAKTDAAYTLAVDTDATFNKSDGKTARARKADGLKDMLEMPVDIISEITRHLHPQDLLSLSWSSKSLHKFFMRKGSQYMWRQSFRSLPWQLPCPEGIIEPAWATLLFTKVCTGCGTCTTDRDPIWVFNARFCDACATTKIINTWDPLRFVLGRDKAYLVEHIPLAVFTPHRACPYSSSMHLNYLRSEMEEIIDNWDMILELGDEDALALFIGECILRVHRAPVHVSRCQAWAKIHAQAVIDEEIALKSKYLKDVISRLRDLGWGDELDLMQSIDYAPLRGHRHFETPQQLTDDVWESMRDEMDQCMEQAREDRIVRDRMQVLQERWTPLEATLTTLSHLPEARAYNIAIGDIALMPEIREIVDVSEEVSVDEASFAEVHAKFGDMAERWKLDGAAKLRELVFQWLPTLVQPKPKETKREGKGKAKAKPEVDVLELATVRFHCNNCHDGGVALYWPGVLAHECLRDVPHSEEDDAYKRFICDKMMRRPSTAMFGHLDRLKVAEPSNAAKAVIRLCGKNPDTATVEDMNSLNVMLLRDDDQIRTWRNAILFDDTQRAKSKWILATPAQIVAAMKRLPDIEMQRSHYQCTVCYDCYARKMWYDEALEHIRRRHNRASKSLDHKFLERRIDPDGLFIAGVIKMTLK